MKDPPIGGQSIRPCHAVTLPTPATQANNRVLQSFLMVNLSQPLDLIGAWEDKSCPQEVVTFADRISQPVH